MTGFGPWLFSFTVRLQASGAGFQTCHRKTQFAACAGKACRVDQRTTFLLRTISQIIQKILRTPRSFRGLIHFATETSTAADGDGQATLQTSPVHLRIRNHRQQKEPNHEDHRDHQDAADQDHENRGRDCRSLLRRARRSLTGSAAVPAKTPARQPVRWARRARLTQVLQCIG